MQNNVFQGVSFDSLLKARENFEFLKKIGIVL